MNQPAGKWLGAIAVLLIFYVFLRLWNLTASCLWFDEIFSVHAATLAWRDLFWFVAQDLIHPPFFYVLLKIWILACGESISWLRLFPFFFSILFLIPFFLLARELKLSPAAVALALFFLTFSGSFARYGQEVRMYCVLMFLGATSLWLSARFTRGGKGFWWLFAINVLLVHTHYYGWLAIAAEIICVFILARFRFKRALTMFALVLLSFLPWLVCVALAMQVNADFNQNLGWAAKPDLRTILFFVIDLHQPAFFLESSADDRRLLWFSAAPVMITIPVLALYFRKWKTFSDEEKSRTVMLSVFILTPVCAAFAASWLLPFSVWGTRHGIFIYAPYYILAATALLKIASRPAKIVLFGIVLINTIAALAFHLGREKPPYIWCAWENLAEKTRRADAGKAAKIYVFEDLTAYHFWFALRDSEREIEIVKVNGVQTEDKAYFLPRGFDGVKTVDRDGIEGEKFWVAFRAAKWDETRQPLRGLRQKGYRFGEPEIYEAEGLKAFLVEVEK